MKLLWFSWKDMKNPLAGGAELVTHQLCAHAVKAGHEVILLCAGYPGAAPEEMYSGYKIIRVGGRLSVYPAAANYYKANLRGWADLVIEEINTIPFFTQLYVKEPRFVLFYMLCREIWFYQMFFPASLIGYLIEPLYLLFLNRNRILTISESTKHDLMRFGFPEKNITIIPIGLETEPVSSLKGLQKFEDPTVLSLGTIRDMKQTLDQVKAFNLAKAQIPNLKMKIAGGGAGPYFNNVMKAVKTSPYSADIEYLGRVSTEEKAAVMRKSHVIAVTSVKEGWGLIVNEANSQGTPAVTYDVDGLRDSNRNNETGLVVAPNPKALAAGIVTLLSNPEMYEAYRTAGWEWSKDLTFENSYKKFSEAVSK